jgi:hypothetical protein
LSLEGSQRAAAQPGVSIATTCDPPNTIEAHPASMAAPAGKQRDWDFEPCRSHVLSPFRLPEVEACELLSARLRLEATSRATGIDRFNFR